MSALDELFELQALAGLLDGDYYENELARKLQSDLGVAESSLQRFYTDTGLTGPADDTARAWAQSLESRIAAVKKTLAVWASANNQARDAMRTAAHKADEIAEMIPTQAQLNVLAIQPEAISPITGLLVSGWQAAQDLKKQKTDQANTAAQQVLDIMNRDVLDAIPIEHPRMDPGPSGSSSGAGYGGGSGWGGGFVPLAPPVATPYVPSHADLSDQYTPGDTHPSGANPSDPSASGDATGVGMDPHTTSGGGKGGAPAGAVGGLSAAAVMAAFKAYGPGSVETLGPAGPDYGVAPVGGVIGARPTTPPTTTPAVGMGSTGATGAGGDDKKKRRQRDPRTGRYPVVQIDHPEPPPDPGPGAQAGSVETMGFAPPLDPEDEWWDR